jgi:hypothetical protein
MTRVANSLGLVLLVLVPVGLVCTTGYQAYSEYVALGIVLTVMLGVLARPVAKFAVLLPVLYAAAAVTAASTDGVAALIVAVAAGVGAASSLGLHRGLLAVLAVVLIGSVRPQDPSTVLGEAALMLLGCSYGYLLVVTVLRDAALPALAVHPQTALSYAVLQAFMVLTAWLIARTAGFPLDGWMPLAVAAVGEPSLTGTSRRAVLTLAATLAGVMLMVWAEVQIVDISVRVALLGFLMLILFSFGRSRRVLQSALLTPIVALSALPLHDAPFATGQLGTALLVCGLIFAVSILGRWVLWTLRPDQGHFAT